MQSISTCTSFGRRAASTVDRAGEFSGKKLAELELRYLVCEAIMLAREFQFRFRARSWISFLFC